MPFLKFSRDKRGYEHFYLVQPVSGRRGRPEHQILYCFRTPPNVKVGREPFDEQVRRALEAQNPGVRFDWDALVRTPIPPPEAEDWRERRRAVRAARQMAETEEEGELDETLELETSPVVLGSGEEEDPTPPVAAPTNPPAEVATLSPHRQRRRRRRGRRRSGNEAPPSAGEPNGG